jgi:predicted amidohydrolase YtcJ
VEKLIPPPTGEDKIKALLKAQSNCFAVGLTSVGDAGLYIDIVELMDSLQKKGPLQIHINAMLNPNKENIDFYINKGTYETDRLTVRSIKLFADGALGSRGALLKQPYADDPSNLGLQVGDTKFLEHICRLAYAKGYQVNTHCIGDSAVSLVLRIYASILSEHNDLRWRIEHAQVVDPADLAMFKRYAVIPSVQTTHATSDMYWAEDRLGPVRITHAYAYRSLLEQNGWIPNGSDFPVESINPVYGFYAAVARKDLQGMPAGGFHREQTLTREQALKAMTIWAARASFGEKSRGSLEPGKEADFVVLDRDIMTVPEDSIAGAKVLETWIKGKTQRW